MYYRSRIYWASNSSPFTRNHCEVVGVDVNEEIVNNLNEGIVHIEEPGISDIIKNAVKNKVYVASLTPQKLTHLLLLFQHHTSLKTTAVI